LHKLREKVKPLRCDLVLKISTFDIRLRCSEIAALAMASFAVVDPLMSHGGLSWPTWQRPSTRQLDNA
jgi:hypothetical protein